MSRRWAKATSLTIGKQWGDMGDGGVAACMVWDYGQPSKAATEIDYDYVNDRYTDTDDLSWKHLIDDRTKKNKPPPFKTGKPTKPRVVSANDGRGIGSRSEKNKSSSVSKLQQNKKQPIYRDAMTMTTGRQEKGAMRVRLDNDLAGGEPIGTSKKSFTSRFGSAANEGLVASASIKNEKSFVEKVAKDCVHNSLDEIANVDQYQCVNDRMTYADDMNYPISHTHRQQHPQYYENGRNIRTPLPRSRSAYGLNTFRSYDSCAAEAGDTPLNSYRSIVVRDPPRTVLYNNGQPRVIVSQDDQYLAKSRKSDFSESRGKMLEYSDGRVTKRMNMVADGAMSVSVHCPSDAKDMQVNVRLHTTTDEGTTAKDPRRMTSLRGRADYVADVAGDTRKLKGSGTGWTTGSRPAVTFHPQTPIAAGTPAWNNYMSRQNTINVI